MRSDPGREWQTLTDLYREMGDQELYELAEEFGNLTEVAQQVLRGEMSKRRLKAPGGTKEAAKRPARAETPQQDNPGNSDQEDEVPHEYTWKTALFASEEWSEAWQVYEALRRAGIDVWIEGPRRNRAMDQSGCRVLVAADQLEEAREIASRPIPREIAEEARIGKNMPEYEAPQCPSCGAEDPVLEDVEPSNRWLCESCGEEWSDAAEGVAENPEAAER
jgi:hypothetical protein